MLCGKLRSKITGTLKVTLIISFVAQVDQWAPRVGTHEPALGTNEPMRKTVQDCWFVAARFVCAIRFIKKSK